MQLSNFQKGLLWVVLAALVLGGTLFINRLVFSDAFNKEEAQHAIYGLWIYKDVKALDWGGFWNDTQRQMFWPFLHSWLQAAVFLVFGVSYISARLLSFIIFLATLFLMYVVGHRLSDRSGWKIGLLAVALALTSPIMLRFAVENTMEGLGALIFIASFYYWTVCEERKLFYEYVVLGLLISLSIYADYLYAYLMIPAFVVVTLAKLGPLAIHAFKLSRRGEQGALHFVWWAYKKLIILGVLLALSASWFFSAAFFRKLLILFQAIFRTSGGEMITGFWQGLFYYPGAIIAHYSFSPWLGVLIVVALLKPFIASSYRQLDKLYAFIWTVILLITLTVSAKAPQFIYIIGPFLFILFAAAFFYWADKLDKKYVAALSLAVFLPAVVSLPALWGEYFPPRPAENMLSVLKYFRSQAQTRDALACSFNLQRLNPEVVAFHFWDWNAPVLSDQALGEDAMFGNAGILFSLKLEPDSPIIGQVLDDSHARWNIFLEGKMRQKLIREVSVRNFAALGLTAKIYAKSGY